MKLNILHIKPNPYRDMDIDPINEEAVESLKRSIEDHDFWNGLLVRKQDKEYQLVFGHHRLEAAKRAGITEVEVPIVRWDDGQMVQAMAAENATQRETNFSACANDVAAAMRVLGYQMLTHTGKEPPKEVWKIFQTSEAWRSAKGKLLAGSGLGRDILHRYFDSRLSKGILREVIAQLKASGKMAEITDGVIDKAIADGHKIDVPSLQPVEKTFDMAVGQVLTNPSHLAAFRKSVVTVTGKEAIPVAKQVAFAKQLVKDINQMKRPTTGRKQPLTADVIRRQAASHLDPIVSAHVVQDKTSDAIRAHHNFGVKVRKQMAPKGTDIDAQHEWSFARNKMAHARGHMGKLQSLLKRGVKPHGFDAIAAQSFFRNDYAQFITLVDDVKQLMSIYFVKENNT